MPTQERKSLEPRRTSGQLRLLESPGPLLRLNPDVPFLPPRGRSLRSSGPDVYTPKKILKKSSGALVVNLHSIFLSVASLPRRFTHVVKHNYEELLSCVLLLTTTIVLHKTWHVSLNYL